MRAGVWARARPARLAPALCLLVWASPLAAVTPATLIGPDLDPRPVSITSLDDGTLNYFDEQRTLRNTAVNQFVQLRSVGGEDTLSPMSPPGVWLTDGQRFTGDWVGPTPDGAALRWRHPLIGTVVIPLEEVARVAWIAGDGPPAPLDAPTQDTLTLTNGDTLLGFVSSLTEHGVALLPEVGGAPVTIPFGRIASMSLANPAGLLNEPYHRVTLSDGTRVWADDLRITDDRMYCRVIPPGSPAMQIELPVAELARIDFWAGGLRLIDLAELPRRTLEEARVFGLPVPVRVTGRSIRMHAPGSVAFELPAGSERFAGVAELDTRDAPPGIAVWADFQVVVSSKNPQDQRFRVTGHKRIVRINIPVAGPGLTIRLDPGMNGPILDRLLLRDAVILVRLPGAEPSGDPGR